MAPLPGRLSTPTGPESGSGTSKFPAAPWLLRETAPEASNEEITYHAVEKDGVVTAIWEMQGRKHLRTIDPRSRQGQDILRLYTTEHHDETSEVAATTS